MARKRGLSHEERESLNKGAEPLTGDDAIVGTHIVGQPELFQVPEAVTLPRYRNQANYTLFKNPGEKNNGISKTTPDMTLSMREMVRRHTKGLHIDGGRVPIFNGPDDDLPDLNTLDLADRQIVLENVEKEIREINERKIKTAREAQKKRQDAEVKKLLDMELKRLQESKQNPPAQQ